MKTKILNLLFIILICSNFVNAQIKRPPYEYPKDVKVVQTIKEWQDLKFGLFIHWGTYSQWGIVESWSLCPEDRPNFSVRPEGMSYNDYVKEYEKLKTTFNPVNFDPQKWADAAKYAGMKYVVFTTKHHDGFNMYDTQFTDYKITSKECPFSSNPKANITKEIFNTFQDEDFETGIYYSVTDWNHNDFWWDYFPPANRQINYSIKKYPEKWKSFNDFVYNQLNELTNGDYGKIIVTWFDLCNSITDEAKLDWPRMTKMLRENQPGVIMVARGARGQNENYLTPEKEVPDNVLDHPWETNMTMGESWSYEPGEEYKSVYELVQMLVKIVSRGGNFLLNIGPRPDGDFDPKAYDRLKGIGDWMAINSEAIYKTKPVAPFFETKLVFTKKDDSVYAFYLPEEDEKKMPAQISISNMLPKSGSSVYLLGYNKPLKWWKNGKGFVVEIPKNLQNNPVCDHVWTLKFIKQ
ncbi:alpha-L-fucosidase [uncultured Draconibacterium sp.]|uniref:alpha-L-fucosidase n=1 Tax=uncultured Draconibacterium sp. TaxID=1573823 RepID=UPI0025D6C07F|nr:alpha-L-fucosidase [uncultured Draconibacterium sp.]